MIELFAVAPDNVAGHADDGGIRRHLVQYDGVRRNAGIVADLERTEHLRAAADHDVVAERRVALAVRHARAAERNVLIEQAVVADLRCRADDDAGAVVDDEPSADLGGRVDLNARPPPRKLRDPTAENRIKGMIRIRDSVRTLLEMQTEDYPDSDIKAEQEKLNRLYDEVTKKYGLINSRANVSAFSQDSSYSLLSALEVLDDNGELERKADLFTKRTIKPHTPVTAVDTASEALAVSMGEKAAVDMAYMCALTGKTEQEIFADLKGVIFLNPLYGYGDNSEPKYLMADEYLSGNVREKLALARKSAEVYPEDYTVNVEALEKVQPKDLSASEIFVQLGSTWVPEEIVQQFMFEFLDTPRWAYWNIKVHYSKFTSEWNVEGKSYDRGNVKANSTYGTPRINA